MRTDLLNAKHIASILKVAEYQSFSQAAWQLFFTESAVSKHVAYAEKSLGVQIFRRSSRGGVSLTAEGTRLLPYLRALQDGYEALERFTASLGSGAFGTLRFASPEGYSSLGDDQLLARFCKCYPEAKISYSAMDARSALQHIRGRQLDLALCPVVEDRPRPAVIAEAEADPQLESHVFKTGMPLLIAIAEGHPAIRKGAVELARLRDEVFIFKDYPKYFLELCRKEGFEPRLLPHNSLKDLTVFEMVAKGGYVVPLFFQPAAPCKGMCVLPFAQPAYNGSAILFCRRDNQSPALRAFLKFVREAAE